MSREGLIISAVGRDRPGIVDNLSGIIFEQGCNLEDSRMAILGGEFALIVLVSGSEDGLEQVKRAAGKICADLDFTAQFRTTRIGPAGPEAAERLPYRLTAVSLDHPGIVHRITHVLAQHGVNVANLETRIGLAPVSGSPIFSLEMEAQVPAAVSIAQLRDALRKVAEEENIDVDLRGVAGERPA